MESTFTASQLDFALPPIATDEGAAKPIIYFTLLRLDLVHRLPPPPP